jgi:hypothetical protein
MGSDALEHKSDGAIKWEDVWLTFMNLLIPILGVAPGCLRPGGPEAHWRHPAVSAGTMSDRI